MQMQIVEKCCLWVAGGSQAIKRKIQSWLLACCRCAVVCSTLLLWLLCSSCVDCIFLACWEFVASAKIGDMMLMGGWWVAAIPWWISSRLIKLVQVGCSGQCGSHTALCCSSIGVLHTCCYVLQVDCNQVVQVMVFQTCCFVWCGSFTVLLQVCGRHSSGLLAVCCRWKYWRHVAEIKDTMIKDFRKRKNPLKPIAQGAASFRILRARHQG